MPLASEQKRRRAVEMIVFGNMKTRDVAAQLAVTQRTVTTWLRQERAYIEECQRKRQEASASAWAIRLARHEP